jgi:hypothetical protein
VPRYGIDHRQALSVIDGSAAGAMEDHLPLTPAKTRPNSRSGPFARPFDKGGLNIGAG